MTTLHEEIMSITQPANPNVFCENHPFYLVDSDIHLYGADSAADYVDSVFDDVCKSIRTTSNNRLREAHFHVPTCGRAAQQAIISRLEERLQGFTISQKRGITILTVSW